MNLKYRPEIDGLRAVAVLPVILFHAGFSTFSGGFVGVDVFFVISGYLITSIISKDMESGTFSFWDFYERRARRILPALFLVMLCCIPFAWMWMLPMELEAFSASVVAVCLFASNILFWKQSGYFDAGAELKPLLHTWSLAVEEQYYIIFPIAILLLWRLGRRHVIWSIAIVAVLSLALSEYASWLRPAANFYLLPTRGWELMAGSLCSFAIVRRNSWPDNILSLAGFAAIAVSVFAYDKSIPFPSLYALLPVLGTCAILLFAQQGTLVGALLSFKPLVGLGLVSYSAYLWHQPVFAFAHLRSLIPLTLQMKLSLAIASIALAYLSWRFVEVPARKRRAWPLPSRRAAFAAFGILVCAFMTAGMVGHLARGFPWRMSQSALNVLAGASDIGRYVNECLWGPTLDDAFVAEKCHMGVEGQPIDFLLFGDSYAAAIADGVDLAAKTTGHSGLLYSLHGCVPIASIGGMWSESKEKCKPFQQSLLEIVEHMKPKIVILNANWMQLEDTQLISDNNPTARSGFEAFFKDALKTVDAFKESGAKVYVVCCTPHAVYNFDIPRSYARMQLFGTVFDMRQSRSEFEFQYRTALAIFKSSMRKDDATLVDIEDFFCDSEKCDLMRNGRSLFFDWGHLSRYGSDLLSPIFKNIFVSSSKK